MLLTQSFNSVNEIDGDFVPALEQLLAQYIPSFQSLQDYEKNAAKDNLFSYYLFFGKKTNAPIGFAQVEFEKKQPIKQSLIERYVKKSAISVGEVKHRKRRKREFRRTQCRKNEAQREAPKREVTKKRSAETAQCRKAKKERKNTAQKTPSTE